MAHPTCKTVPPSALGGCIPAAMATEVVPDEEPAAAAEARLAAEGRTMLTPTELFCYSLRPNDLSKSNLDNVMLMHELVV
jgi:hypothetical protein